MAFEKARLLGDIGFIQETAHQYSLAKQTAESILSQTFFPLSHDLSQETKERMVKLAATTLLLQNMNCRVLDISPKREYEKGFVLMGAIIDPYDGAQDTLPPGEAFDFCQKVTEVVKPGWEKQESFFQNPQTEFAFRCLSLFQKEIPLEENPEFWKVFMTLHAVQTVTLLQRTHIQNYFGIRISDRELHAMSFLKGGLNALLFASCISPAIGSSVHDISHHFPSEFSDLPAYKEYILGQDTCCMLGNDTLVDALFEGGVFVQEMDDFEDVSDDIRDGIETFLTRSQSDSVRFFIHIPNRLREVENAFQRANIPENRRGEFRSALYLYTVRKALKRVGKLV